MPLLGVALAALLPFALLAVWVRFEPVAEWEVQLLGTLAAPAGLPGDVIREIDFIGDLRVWTVLVVALAFAAAVLRRMWAALLILFTIAADLAGFAVKLVVERARPEGALVEHLLGGDTFAFPSGHALRATALVAVVVWITAPSQLRLPAAVAAGAAAGLLMGYVRIALGVHWPTDVVGGLLLGVAWFGFSAWLAERQA